MVVFDKSDWVECDKDEYNYRDRINFMYEVSEANDEVTYYKKKISKWFKTREEEGNK